ncbi:MAG TPA: META domain-containing protein [Methyloceanibacter sp.]|jgi:putative lipoprotein|nr:META domain-containing protein [Methyloceanibacter sp.]
MPLLGLVLAVGTAGVTMGVDLSGSKWHPSFMTALEIPSGVHMTVQFGPDGRITGFGGCNRFFGGYTISGDHIKIGPLGSTRKGCLGLTQLETSFFATLEAAKSFEQDENTLTLFGAAGDKLAQFVRATDE